MSLPSYQNPLRVEAEPLEASHLGELASQIISQLPGCPDVLVRQTLQRVLRDFCRDTGAFTCSYSTAMEDGKSSYQVKGIPADTVVDCICRVTINDRVVPEKFGYSISFGSVISVNLRSSSYSSDDTLNVIFCVVPKIGAETLPSWFIEKFGDALNDGAMFNLLSMSGRPWSDPQRAAQFGIQYSNARSTAAFRRIDGSQAANGDDVSIIPREEMV